ncbi:winged helix-turn-helix domain-containing protein [Streptomyces sp. NPDC059506]|uniref:winged helix-turn-helix domain-containing protein n=1 Tax=Streptomyces TaxID=1883 RepID=UPI0021753461|nr:winged helix-turn-helix domain-containing protein [Streptomyces sp. SCUT-3]
MPGPRLRVSVLGPLRVWLAGQPVDVGPVRRQAVPAALALSPDRSVSRQELLDGVWGTESPGANVVPVYVYRRRKILRLGECPDPVLGRGRYGYGLARGAAEGARLAFGPVRITGDGIGFRETSLRWPQVRRDEVPDGSVAVRSAGRWQVLGPVASGTPNSFVLHALAEHLAGAERDED